MRPTGELLRLLASLLGGMVLSDLCPSEIAVVRKETTQSLGLHWTPKPWTFYVYLSGCF